MGKRSKLRAIVTIVLAIGLTSVFAGDSAGSMPDMDNDLGASLHTETHNCGKEED
jgi:hypothetical protein